MTSSANNDKKFMSTKEAADIWNTDKSIVAKWCRDKRIPDAKQSAVGRPWAIPSDAKRPLDVGLTREILWQIIEIKNGGASDFDLTSWGISAEFVDGYIAALVGALYLSRRQDGDLRLTQKGLKAIGRGKKEEEDAPETLIYVASAAGAFTGAFLRQVSPLWS